MDAIGNRPGVPNDARRLDVGIGLHGGEVFRGLVGEASRYECTVLGDTVNVAPRREQATKAHDVAILASAAVCAAAEGRQREWLDGSGEPLRGWREATPYCKPTVPLP